MTLDMFLSLWSAGAFLFLQADGETQESQSVEIDEGSSNGVCLTLSTSESPRDVVESSLSSILERGGVDSRYYLSRTAVIGILRRADSRGKELPNELRTALINRAKDGLYGKENIANTGKILRVLWEEIGEDAFKSWVSRVFILVQSEKILFSELFIKSEYKTTNKQQDREATSKVYGSGELLSRMWKDWEDSSTSYRRKPTQQLKEQLNSALLELSRKEASTEIFVRCLWYASKGSQPMQQALASMEEIKSTWMGYGIYKNDKDQDARSVGESCYCLQGSMIGREDKNGPQGDGININKSFTLNTTDRHAVAIRTAQTGANGIGVADEKAHTLDGANGQAVCFTPSSFGGYQEGVGTLRANGDGCDNFIYENHAQDSRVTESVGVCPTLHSQMGTGGNVPFVLTPLLK
jgi:hypothetical protein